MPSKPMYFLQWKFLCPNYISIYPFFKYAILRVAVRSSPPVTMAYVASGNAWKCMAMLISLRC